MEYKTSAKLDIADEIYNKFDKVINKKMIYAAIQVICKALSNSLIADEKIVVENFIELETYIFPEHKCKNIHTGILECIDQKKCIRMKVDKGFMKVVRNGVEKVEKKRKVRKKDEKVRKKQTDIDILDAKWYLP